MCQMPFADLPPTPAQHCRLCYFAAVLHLLDQLTSTFGSRDRAAEQFPFLAGYQEELSRAGQEVASLKQAETWWWKAVSDWEETVPVHLPLRAMREAGDLGHSALTLLLTTGMIEEDARFGLLFESLQGTPGQHRPTVGLLNAWWRNADGCNRARATLRRLQELGLVHVVNPASPLVEWALQPPAPV